MKLNFLFVIILLSFSFITSCSKNISSQDDNQTEESSDSQENGSTEDTNMSNAPVSTEATTNVVSKKNKEVSNNDKDGTKNKTNNYDDQSSPISDSNIDDNNKYNNKYNYKLIKNKYNLSKETFNLINSNMLEFATLNRDESIYDQPDIADAIKEDKEDNIDEEKNTQAPEKVENEEPEELPFPIIISIFNIKDNLDLYSKSYLPNYVKIAEAKFTSTKKITLEDIKYFGSYISSDVALVKSFTETSTGKFVYSIVFLSGDISNEQNYWYRNIEESLDILESLKKLKISDINDYENVMTKKEKSEMLKKQKALDIKDELTDNNQQTNNSPENPEENSEEELIDLEIELQKKLIKYRVEKLIGIWQDINTNELYEIRELKNKKNNVSLYAGYLFVQETEDSLPPYLSNLNINSTLNWLPKDLKFEFLGTDGEGFYVTEEKMLATAKIIGYPFKGYIMIQLPNGHLRYLVPLVDKKIADVVYDELYSEILKYKVNQNIEEEHLYSYKIGTKDTKGVDSFSVYWFIAIGLFIGLSFL